MAVERRIKLVDRLIASVPPVSPDWQLDELVVGPFFTMAIVSTPEGLRAGLSGNLGRGAGADPDLAAMARSEAHRGGLKALVEWARSPRLARASVGLALINALLEVDGEQLAEINARDLILERGRGRRVAVVGHFPFVARIRDVAAEAWVLELRPTGRDLPADEADRVLPRADVVAITGTTVLNDTYDELVALCRPEAYVLVLGGTTPLTPLFFDDGVDAVAGTLVEQPEAMLQAVRQGISFRRMPGRRLVTLFPRE
jgi:hypothetical protein